MRKSGQKIGAVLAAALLAAVTVGCQSLNDDPNNRRIWYPSLVQPGHLNPAHESQFPEGSDPFPNAAASRSVTQPRPQYWDMPRDWNADVDGGKSVKVIPSEAAATTGAASGRTAEATATLVPAASASSAKAALQP